MLRNILMAIVIGVAILAAWKFFGGDLGVALATIWDVFFNIIDQGSDAVLGAIESLRGV